MRFVILVCLVLACGFSPSVVAAGPVATVTLLEGAGLLTRGTARYTLAEGVLLEQGDIVELSDKSLAQVEFGDAALVALGPQSRVLLLPPAAKTAGTELFLLHGQMKATVPATAYRLTTPLAGVGTADSTAVLQGSVSEAALFMERGDAKVQELTRDKAVGKPLEVKNGEFYLRTGDQMGEVVQRPSAAFVAALPKPFLDNLPPRLVKFADRKVELRKTQDFSYADVEDWLKSTPAVRRFLVPRWRAKARDPAFRNALVANLRDHPEWDRILFPEKYEEAAKAKAANTIRKPGG